MTKLSGPGTSDGTPVGSKGTDRGDIGAPPGGAQALPPALTRRPPPVAELVVGSIVLMLTGGITLAASLPRPPDLAPAIGLVVAGGVLTVAAVVVLSRCKTLAWDRFFQVVRWALLAYAVFAGILVDVFVTDHTAGGTLAVLAATLVVFAVDVPLVLAFTVAWYQQPRPADRP